jgi:hypothetical protein
MCNEDIEAAVDRVIDFLATSGEVKSDGGTFTISEERFRQFRSGLARAIQGPPPVKVSDEDFASGARYL